MAKGTWKELTDLLGLSVSATPDEVKKAYRSFAKTDHPDRNANSNRKEEFARVSTLIGFMNKGQLSPDFQPEELIEEEDPFADLMAQKEKSRAEAKPIYEPTDGKDITIERTIDATLANNGGKLIIPITGAALLASNLVREKKIEVDIKPKSWGRHQVVLKGKGRPGLFGGKSGNLIISIKSQPLKEPVSPTRVPKPDQTNNRNTNKNTPKVSTPTFGEHTKIRPAVLPKPEYPPKPFPTTSINTNVTDEKIYPSAVIAGNIVSKGISNGNRLRNISIFLIISIWLFNYVSNNVDKQNSWDASFAICDATNSMHATIFFDKYYGYESPYKAAIYYKYFKEDFDAQDMVSEIANQYPRIQHAQYAKIKSISEKLYFAISRNDTSIISAMNQMQKECGARDFPWNE